MLKNVNTYTFKKLISIYRIPFYGHFFYYGKEIQLRALIPQLDLTLI
jgi:hypothetical protein